jgi:hypothetical protein
MGLRRWVKGNHMGDPAQGTPRAPAGGNSVPAALAAR